MVVEVFEIRFDRPHKTYFSGEKVTGQVLVQANQEENIEGSIFGLWNLINSCAYQ